MSASNGVEGTFLIDVLECTVCYSIPPTTSMVLCQNGHVFCTPCRQRLAQCGICQSAFENRHMSNVLQKILTSLQVDCKFKDLGCSKKMNLEERDSHEKSCRSRNVCKYVYAGCAIRSHNLEDHEESCEFREIRCYNQNCQRKNQVTHLGPMAEVFYNHYISLHENSARRKELESLTEFELSGSYSKPGCTFLSNGGKVHYIFVGSFGVDKLEHSLKACLVSTAIPREAMKLKCFISMKHQGREIMNYVGKVFSIDETANIHSMYDGGMIFPNSLRDAMEQEEVTFSFKISERF